ncbi:hypothetical protein GO755_00325 [Spirosoma sp. HMF4905]|uniref:Signal transduction histidine kinase internal region domain-containing protein n=1 Tax=Spirosoma arboris TaxID=2682092 RepID=A0A7K1S4C2_9BACT|nr:histidine kinase [Spirosoma arboris]MVM28456.1 hypothetical protein [Spirosoma arboris]
MKRLLRIGLLTSLVWLLGAATWAQTSALFPINSIPPDGILLDKNWLWQSGDDSQWAKPEFNDRRWQAIDPTKDIMDLPQARGTSVSWFRLHFSLKDSIPHQLALLVWQVGASEIYLDGKRIHQLGQLTSDPSAIKAINPAGKPISFPVGPSPNHVLAVRYALQPNLTYTTIFLYENRGFKAVINTMERSIDQYHQANDFERSSFRIGVIFILAILYLAFYLFYPIQRAYLYFSFYGFFQTCVWSIELYIRFQPRVELQYLLHLVEFNLAVFDTVLMLWSIYSLLEQPKDWVFKSLSIFGIFCMIMGTFIYGWGWLLFGFFFLNLTGLDVTRIAIRSVKQQRKGAWIILGGSTSFLLSWALFTLSTLGFMPPLPIDTFSIAHLSIPIVVALYMGYQSAIAHRSLHHQLAEVERLSQEKQQLLAMQNTMLEQQLVQQTNEAMLERQLEEQRVNQLRTDFERRAAEAEMAGLRSQMNPHFIFNCLNSIKLYAIENESEKASEYLTKFSRLIRMVLENSRSERVTLQNELETLRLYMDMEAMRFKQKLSFRIDVAPDVDARFLEIPPLLIQPYVENAIWHGLMHKPTGGTVHVKATLPQETLLQLTITDDGVGRARSAELKSKSASHRKSFGLKMTSERISLVNQIYQTQTQAQIMDLVDSFGEPCGTKVILEIPV